MVEKAQLCFGGVPTDPEIKRIRDKWPDADLRPGQTITCDEVAVVIGESVQADRFQTVTTRWRRLVEKGPSQLVIARRNYVFFVLRDGEVVNSNEADIRQAVKKTRRASARAQGVDVAKLSEDEKKRHDLHVGLTAKLLATANVRRNGTKQLPKMD